MLTKHLIDRAAGAEDWTIPQSWERFTAEDHRVWDLLFARQSELLEGRAIRAFHDGLDLLDLGRPGIPDFERLNARLFPRTGWTVVSVPGLIPDAAFFDLLRQRRFPAGNFIRAANSLDYLEEPDVFHDVFGHVPLLADPAIADFMAMLGALGLEAIEHDALHRLSRLYWHTVEFGLAREGGQLKVYGAGIASSFGETRHALEADIPRRAFDLAEVMRTAYRSDAMQPGYVVVEDFGALLDEVRRADLPALYRVLDGTPDLSIN